MNIRELKCGISLNDSSADISLNYNEIRDISNALNKMIEQDLENLKKFGHIARQMDILFDLVKNGSVDIRTIENYKESYDTERNLRDIEEG